MVNPTAYLTGTCLEQLQQGYRRAYGSDAPDYATTIGWIGRMALTHIARSSAPYHNVEHTVLVSLVGQEILQGKYRCEGNVTPRDWAHVIIALLCHDIGYVRGVCRNDGNGSYTTGHHDQYVTIPAGATDAFLTPYHVDRGKCFVWEHLQHQAGLDVETICAYIERTRFPVPHESAYQCTADYAGLVRAADFIGQLADPKYLCKLPALFDEFEEIGTNKGLGYTTPDDLRAGYPTFFRKVVHFYIQDGLRYLRMTHAGQQWIRSLYTQVAAAARRPAYAKELSYAVCAMSKRACKGNVFV